jgi:diadenosine tetraphosphate (Ap4A) HIT family hydrolase
MSRIECPFCSLNPTRIWAENTVAIAVYDGFQLTEGHTLVIPNKHVSSVFDLSLSDQQTTWALVAEVREWLRWQAGRPNRISCPYLCHPKTKW